MPTVISTSIPYASPADIRDAHDFRQCGDFLNDDGTRVTTTAAVDANSKVTAALMKASGLIEMACTRGNKYSVEDLQSLAGAGRAALVDLCVELAWWKLNVRRWKDKVPVETQMALNILDSLSSGERIFPLADQANAGNPQNGFMTFQQWTTLNPAMVQARPYFGRRAWERVPGGSSNGQGCGSCDD